MLISPAGTARFETNWGYGKKKVKLQAGELVELIEGEIIM